MSVLGVIPPSITEKVVMLRSLEAHECGGGVGNSSMETSSNTTGSLSLRKKKRSGSLQGTSYQSVSDYSHVVKY